MVIRMYLQRFKVILWMSSVLLFSAPGGGELLPLTDEVNKELASDNLGSRLNVNNRIECFPFQNMVQESCEQIGCLWEPIDGQPSCFLPDNEFYGYEINSAVTTLPASKGFSVDLRRRRPYGNETVVFSLYGNDYDEVTFQVSYHTDSTLSFALYPRGTKRESWRPPIANDYSFPNEIITKNRSYIAELVTTTIGQPFNFRVKRTLSDVALFDSSLGGLTLAEQFLMMSTALPTQYVYGLGENTHDSFLHDMNYRMWPIFTRDNPTVQEDSNLYGAHPFYMVSENDGSSHGVFLFNTHAMDITTMPHPGLTFRVIGGMLEFFMFLGPEPETVIQQYTALVGRPAMPPYFALGFHLSRWGYRNTQHIRDVINRTRYFDIPHDVQWVDIDYMDDKRDFTLDTVNFGDLPSLVGEIKDNGYNFIIIIDPAIAVDDNYTSYTIGVEKDVFVKWGNNSVKPPGQNLPNDYIMGTVWPGSTVFPNFFKNSTVDWWTNEIKEFFNVLAFDGLWIDMNEVSCFATNLFPGAQSRLTCPENKWDDPPYETMAARVNEAGPHRLSDRTICMIAQLGEEGEERLNYEMHSLYGYSHAKATHEALSKVLPNKRSMVVSRSTYAGSGKYAFHWLGDNFSIWSNMAASIIGMLEFNMFGIPYVGADICGFTGDASEELCERWMELGAFYPFARNHNYKTSQDQDPGVWPNTVAVSSRKALLVRYRLLPYLYTLFYKSHTTGSTVVRPLYHEFCKDVNVRAIYEQFLWGPALMISPVLKEGETSVQVYFPDDTWYDYYTGKQTLTSGNTTLEAPRDHINLHLRGGYILPAQKPALNTMLSRQNNFELIVSLDSKKAAKGDLFWDDGESCDSIENRKFYFNTYEFKNNQLVVTASKGNASLPDIPQKMDLIEILGWDSFPKRVTISAGNNPSNSEIEPSLYSFDPQAKKLILEFPLEMNVNYTVTFETGVN